MTCFTTHQLRALSAAAGVVGRPHLRAGLLLTLTVACGTGPSDAAESSTGEPDPATTSTTLSSTSADLTTSGASGDASTTSSGTTSTTPASTSTDSTTPSTTTSSDDTTGDTTLLTEFTSTTSTEDTGTGTTGGLDDCIDPRTQDIDWVCCEAQDWQPAPQCTPWGPPAPPPLTRDLLARARAARQELA